jgi:hypothetical protein
MARSVCDADDGGEPGRPAAGPPPWRIAAAYGWLSSELRFGDVYAPFDQRSVAVSISRSLGRQWTVSAGAGAVVSGSLEAGGPWPFVALSASLAASGVNTTGPGGVRAPLTSLDAGLSVSAGKSIAGIVAPYVGAKVFGGPVFWELAGASTTGTDVSHWQVAFGAAANLPFGIDLLVEWAPFGARSAVAQAGWTF